jgi:hypothetical protein
MKDKEQAIPKFDKETASKLVQDYLEKKYKDSLERLGGSFVLIPHLTVEKEYGWVFFFQTKKYMETKDPMDSLMGWGPHLFIIEDGSILGLSGVYWEDRLAHYDWIFFKKKLRRSCKKLFSIGK